MKTVVSLVLVTCMLLVSDVISAGEEVVRFEIIVSKDAEVVETAEIWTRFEEAGAMKVSDTLWLEVVAGKPVAGISTVSGEFYYAHDGEMVLEWAPTMEADLSKTPSFQHTSQESGYRIEVRPRLATLPE